MENIIKNIKISKRVAVVAHTSPDPDCMSSMAALSILLKQLGKEVKCFVDTTKMSDLFKNFYQITDYNCDLNAEDFDTIITVDLPSYSHMGKYGEVVNNFDNTISIDHHPARDLKSKISYVDSSKSSCSEIIYELAEKMGIKITEQFCSYIYAGILGDTNCFQNDNTNGNTFIIASKCLSVGINKNEITFLFCKQMQLNQIILKRIGYENMCIENGIAYNIFTSKNIKQAGTDDSSDFVNDLLNIDDNKFAFVIKYKQKNTYSVSLRCKYGYDVSVIAKKFGGGGHVQASGMMFVGQPKKYAKLIYEECLKQIEV